MHHPMSCLLKSLHAPRNDTLIGFGIDSPLSPSSLVTADESTLSLSYDS